MKHSRLYILPLLLLLVCFLSGCRAPQNPADEFRIHGNIWVNELEGATVYLCPLGADKKIRIDSTIVKNGSFAFSGYKHFMAEIRTKPLARASFPNLLIVTEPGDIYVSLGPENKVSGTLGNDTLQAWQQATEEITRKIKSFGGIIDFAESAGDEASRNLYQHKRDSVYNAYVARTRKMAEGVESPLKEFMEGLYPEK